MRLTKGADVYSAQGEKLGTLDRVVLDPETKEVTHLVISKGGLFKTSKVVALGMLDQEVEDRITLLNPKHDWDEFEDFEETHYVNLDETDAPVTDTPIPDVPGSYWYPPVNLAWWRPGGIDYPVRLPVKPVYVARTTQAIPEGTVALEEGARVVSQDDKYVGNVEQVIVDSQDNRVTHFVVNEGVLFKERKLIPVTWISNIDEDEVHLSSNASVLDRLPGYQITK